MSPIKRFPFTAILGWSATRYETFSICKRKYYYQYYSKYDRQVEVRLIQQLKGLSSIPLAIGSAAHTVIEALLNRLVTTKKVIDREQFFDFAHRGTKHRAETEAFHEVYYGEREAVAVEDLYPKVQVCLENLLDSDRYRWLVGEAAQTSDQWVIEPPGYGESRLEGLKAYFKVDFLFPVGDHFHILDWKTGKSVEEIAKIKAAGGFVDLIQWRAHRSNPVGMADDGYVLEWRLFDAGKEMFSGKPEAKTKAPQFMWGGKKGG